MFDLNSESRQPFSKLTAHADKIAALDFSPHNEFLFLTGGSDGVVKLWDMRYLSEDLHEFTEHTEAVCRVRWNPANESLFASGSADTRVIIWDCARIGSDTGCEEAEEGAPEVLF